MLVPRFPAWPMTTAPASAAQLSRQARRCWKSGAASVSLQVALDASGRLTEAPTGVGYHGAGASMDVGRRAIAAVCACAPYRLDGVAPSSGRFELVLR